MITNEQLTEIADKHYEMWGYQTKSQFISMCREIIALSQEIVEPAWRLLSGYMVTETGIGTYAIDHDAGYYMIIFNDDKYRALYDTAAEAIEAANEDYRSRVLSCLVHGGTSDGKG